MGLRAQSEIAFHRAEPPDGKWLFRVVSRKICEECRYKIVYIGILGDPGKDCMSLIINGRGERIRTSDPLVPNQVLYQAEPLPERLLVGDSRPGHPGEAFDYPRAKIECTRRCPDLDSAGMVRP